MASTKFVLALSETDRRALDELSAHLGVSRTLALRWALRYYVIRGPWRTDEHTLPPNVYKRGERLEVGPDMREVS